MDILTFHLTYNTFKKHGNILSPTQVINLLENKNLSYEQLCKIEELYNKNYSFSFNYLKSMQSMRKIKID